MYRINDKRLGIALKVDEGNKFYYRNVSWTGNSVYETRQLNDMLGISKGETYDKKTLHKRLGIGKHADYEDMSSISSLYQNNGYLFSSIDPGEVVVGEDSIDINVKIFEGKQAKINEVKISGNHRVNDRVIRRELYVRPGELYNRALLMQTIRQLNQMPALRPGEDKPGHRFGSQFQRAGRYFVPARGGGQRQVRDIGRLGLQYVRRLGRRAAEQRVAEKLL